MAIVLTGCTPTPASQGGGISLEQRLKNPLYLERYAETMVDRMADMAIQDDPILEDAGKQKIIEETKRVWLEKSKEARELQREGPHGFFVAINEYVAGEALYLNDMLYLSTTFETFPGPNLHLYLSTEIDPRDIEFPDEGAVDLGQLSTAYADQEYAVPPVEDVNIYRTVVLWDATLERLYGFAQLNY